jgi:putative transposase
MKHHNTSQKREPYPTDLTDRQWQIIAPLIPPAKNSKRTGGRERTTDMREALNAFFGLMVKLGG